MSSKTDKKTALVPKLRFPGFRDTGPWEVKRLGELSEIVRGGSPRPITKYLTTDSAGLNWLKIGDVHENAKYVTSTEEKIIKSALSKTREVCPGDLIMSNSMSFGRPYILKTTTCIHDGWIAVTNIQNNADRDYLYYFILSPISQSYFRDAAAGGGVKNLNADIIKLLSVALPSLSEQQKIADCLSSLDEVIELEAKKLDALKAHKKGLMQQLFPREGETTPRLRFPEFRNAGPWEVKRLGEIFQERSERDGSSLELLSVTLSDGVVKTSQLERKNNASSDLSNYKKVYPNDIVYNSMRMWQGASGVSWWSGIVSPAYTVVVPLENQNSLFWAYYFKHPRSIDKFTRFSQGVTSDTWNLKFPAFSAIRMAFPELDEQQKIADCLSSLDDLIEMEAQKIEALKAHKKGLMQQLFPQEVA
jgi:type I restriction enzyme S subunit